MQRVFTFRAWHFRSADSPSCMQPCQEVHQQRKANQAKEILSFTRILFAYEISCNATATILA
jgi:hypothetical protein